MELSTPPSILTRNGTGSCRRAGGWVGGCRPLSTMRMLLLPWLAFSFLLTGTATSFVGPTLLCHAFSASKADGPSRPRPSSSSPSRPVVGTDSDSTGGSSSSNNNHNHNNILILDHLNLNHERGRHGWVKAFYVDLLGCAWDPRKMDNVRAGRKTVWVNVGTQQFHLPEGGPDAQVLDGVITLEYPSLAPLLERLAGGETPPPDGKGDGTTTTDCGVSPPFFCPRDLEGSRFAVLRRDGGAGDCDGGKNVVLVTDPWGTLFRLVEAGDSLTGRDPRGTQPGGPSEGSAMTDLTIHVPVDANLAGIGRFYEDVLGGRVSRMETDHIQIATGPRQTLTFLRRRGTQVDSHVDLRDEEEGRDDDDDDGTPADRPAYRGNYGVHVSIYVTDLPSTYRRVASLGLTYVNPRFSRRAYSLEQAVDDCMFRCIDIVDPEHLEEGPILRLEHEIRSVVRRDGSKYKFCPFDAIPDGCVTLER